MINEIKRVLIGPPDELIISKFKLSIKRTDILTLKGLTWLNDQVINFYMNLIQERSKKNTRLPKIYCMNTFFIPALSHGYKHVSRWTKNEDIFEYDFIFVPVHVGGNHWCMATIHMSDRIIRYYDSNGDSNHPVLYMLEHYLIEETINKKQPTMIDFHWIKQHVTNGPRQMNGSDCAVFSCMYAEYVSRLAPINFTQCFMPYFRNKMIIEISTGQLLT